MKNDDCKFHLDLVHNGQFRLYRFPKGNITIPRNPSLVTINELNELNDCIILGEQGSGIRRCYEWYIQSDTITPSVIVRTNFSTSISIIGDAPEDRQQRAIGYIKEMNDCLNQDDLFQVFLNWHNVIGEGTCHLIFFKPIDTLASHLAGALRKLRDNYYPQKIKITIFSTTDESFFSNAVQSGYIDYCNMFRLARLPISEAKTIITFNLQPNSVISDDCLHKIIDNTGGHPTLIEHHIELIKKIKQRQNKKEVNHAEIDLAFDLLPNSATRIADIWRQNLKELCTKHPLLKNTLINYLSSSIQEHRPIPPEDRQLFIAGWLGFDRHNNWGIVSRFHKNLIRKLLMEV